MKKKVASTNGASIGLKAAYALANSPFNDSNWRGEPPRGDQSWVDGAPSASNEFSDPSSVHERHAA